MSNWRRLVFAAIALCTAFTSFGVFAQAPIKAAVYCAVEIGSRGVKGRVYVFSGKIEKNMPSLEPKYTKDVNSNLISSLEGGRYSAKGMNEAADAAALMLTEMKAAHPACKPFVVGSSGAAKGENRDEFAKLLVEKTGVEGVEFVTAEQEAKFAFVGSVPRRMWESTTLVDVGSGNTKIGSLQGNDFRAIEIPFGAVSLTSSTNASGANFEASARVILESQARSDFRKSASRYPVILSRKNSILVGGTVWAMVTYMLPEKGRRNFVKISTKELADFRVALNNGTWTQNAPSRFSGGGVRATFAEDSKKVLETFTKENLLAGLAVLDMYLEARATDGPIYFARSGNWIFGYVQEKFTQEIWGNENIEDHL